MSFYLFIATYFYLNIVCKNIVCDMGLRQIQVRPCETGKFLLRLIEKIMEILTIITKQLITIIIISFDNNKRCDYNEKKAECNKNRWK